MGLFDGIAGDYGLVDAFFFNGYLPGGSSPSMGSGEPVGFRGNPVADVITGINETVVDVVATPVAVVGDIVASGLGYHAPIADFYSGLNNLIENKVTPKQLGNAWDSTANEVAQWPGRLIQNTIRTIIGALPVWLIPAGLALGAIALWRK